MRSVLAPTVPHRIVRAYTLHAVGLKSPSWPADSDEQVVFSELGARPGAVWALHLAAGYVTCPGPVPEFPTRERRRLTLTNTEVRETFDRMLRDWFDVTGARYGQFERAILAGRRAGCHTLSRRLHTRMRE